MGSLKNYPWAGPLGVSESAFHQWQNGPQQTSFAFWALQNKVINRKKYFDWAIQHHRMPFLKNGFLEQYLIKKKEWKKIKDLVKWTREFLPVAVSGDLIFIGCVDPQAIKKPLPFKYRLLLTSDNSLRFIYNFTKKLSEIIDSKMDITQITKTNILNKQKGTQTGVTARKAPLNKASSQASSGDGPATQESPSVFFKRRGGAANINLDFVKSPGPATSKPLHSVDKASVGQQNLQPFLADRKATSTAPAGQKPAKAHFPSPPLSVKKPAPSPVSQEGGAIMPSLGKKPLNPQKKSGVKGGFKPRQLCQIRQISQIG